MKGSVKKNKQTSKWDLVFDAGKDPLTGKRKQILRRGFASKQDANDEMIRLKAEILENEFLDLTHMTYGKYMEEWLQERKSRLQASTFETHSIFYRNVIKPRLGLLKLQQIAPMQIQKFVNDLVNDTSYSGHTIHLIFRIVSSSLKKAKILKLIKDNPSIGITLPRIKRKEINVWSLDQINFFISEAKKIKRLTRCYIGFLMSIFTGMRQGEILGIRWKDIDFESQTIFVRQTLTQNAEIKAGAKNEASVRSIHIPSKLVDELRTHRKQILEEKLLVGSSYRDLDLVICTKSGNPMIPRNFRKEFYNLTEKIGLPKIRFHDLRHTHATILIQQNVNVKLISERLGHADIETTLNTYSHVLPDMQKSVSDKLDIIIGM
ncbi:site-specific integrase [Peribacillus simplex]|uniref:Site-specific integrase n=2 Tax=Peribacillus TaxID=2675229 RepID=A0AA90PDJ1_9BACI|nr:MULTISPECIES: site-specific integrase [Peribacillus]MDP1421151.1 site-specific integrase [Peribacillus simplex]MDP1453918.1 site-specific integrase [Peribacillus frigoritolerans]